MLLYNLAFPKEEICNEKELYVRGGELLTDGVFISKGEEITFDTYFNCFSHIKYKKYTRVNRVYFRFQAEGAGKAEIRQYNADGDIKIVDQEFCGDGKISFELSEITDKGFLFVVFKATENTILHFGGWYADVAEDNLNIGIVICTYRREQWLRETVNNLRRYRHSLSKPFFDVYIVDNGQTIKDDFGEGFFLIPNKNTGGSGGFTRGIKEVHSKAEYTHFLLMDDDITIDADVLQRTKAILTTLKEEMKNASVGGAMLIKDRPYIQLELGADWNGVATKSHRFKVDVRQRREICLNEEDTAVQYNGWFFMCMPVNSVDKYGYPLPLFIKCDDIEYSLRAAEKIIVSSGVAVWHDDFDVKTSLEMEYYIKRNELILNSRFPKGKGALANWKKMILAVGKQTVFQRYFVADLIFKAYDDYFKGPEYVFNVDAEKLHYELRKNCPKLYTAQELNEIYGVEVDESCVSRYPKSSLWKCITLYGYLIPKVFYKKGTAQVDMAFRKPVEFYRQKRVLQFNAVTGKGFVTEIKKSELWKNGFKLIGYLFKMIIKYGRTAKKYKEFEA